MGLFSNFPYTNFHELNLDWILKSNKKAVEDSANAVKTASDAYEYATTYPQSDDFKKAISDTIQKFVDDGTIEDIIATQFYPKLQVAEYSSFLTVGSSGCVCKTINEAIALVKTYPEGKRNVGIIIMPGYYAEEIVEPDLFGMGFFGVGMPKIAYPSIYPHSPLYSAGEATFVGISFIAQNSSSNSYAVHIESQIYDTRTAFKFYNCRFESSGQSACGMGFGKSAEAEFWNCMCIGVNGVYAHNYPVANSDTSALRMFNCSLYGRERDIVLDDSLRMQGDTTGSSALSLSFGGCRGYSGKVLFNDGATAKTGLYGQLPNRLTLERTSINTLPGVDVFRSRFTVQGVYLGTGAYAFIPSTVILKEYNVEKVLEDGVTQKEFLVVEDTNCIRVTTTTTNPNLSIVYIPK